MKRHGKWLVLVAIVAMLALGIGRAIKARQAQKALATQDSVPVGAAAIQLADMDIVTLASGELTDSIAASGSLVAARSAVVKAKVAAELTSLQVREGDSVTQGQTIGQLDTTEFNWKLEQAQQQASAAKAQWQIAQQNLQNNQALVAQGFISRNALDTTLSNAAAAKANFDAAQAAVELAQKSLKDTRLLAPISGQVSQRLAQTGERVAIDGRIVEIVDLDSLEWQVPLSPQAVTRVRVGQEATLRVEGLDGALQARVARINPAASADTRAVMVYLTVPRHAALKQGLFGQGEILVGQQKGLALPLSAIQRDNLQQFVLRVVQGKVIRTEIKTGPASADTAPVLSGLQAGDVVIRDGAGTVREGQSVRLPQAKH